MKHLLIFFAALLLLSSCNRDKDPVVAYTDSELSIEIIESRKNIRFSIDIIGDTINNLNDTFPSWDYADILFDVNSNMELDSLEDFLVGLIEDGRVCESLLVNETTTKPCDLVDDISIESVFGSSALNQTPHVAWEITVPKNRFPDNRFHFRVRTTSPNGIKAYPAYRPTQNITSFFLDQGFEFSW